MYKRILIATDGTQYSTSAIIEATEMARKGGGQVFLLHVLKDILNSDPFGAPSPEVADILYDSAKHFVTTFKGMAFEDGVKNFETIVKQGVFVNDIIDTAREKEADLIMLGRRSSNVIKRLIRGSSTSRILKLAPCDVLVVPWASLIQWDTVILALDERHFSEKAVGKALAIAKTEGSKLIAMAISPSEEGLKKAENNVAIVAKQSAAAGVPSECISAMGNPVVEIARAVAGKKADTVITSGPYAWGLRETFIGGFAERLIDATYCSVLIVRG